ncbi:unnamed protein product [Pleuronectes platessa]|uniref:Uncharacterized protein n=1 Tax=Pleuronectes platessa TaxID=8262 RepID=A0A9N7UC87_PLEPL|nr:unnamed protein product [Pleuronectes platessa]
MFLFTRGQGDIYQLSAQASDGVSCDFEVESELDSFPWGVPGQIPDKMLWFETVSISSRASHHLTSPPPGCLVFTPLANRPCRMYSTSRFPLLRRCSCSRLIQDQFASQNDMQRIEAGEPTSSFTVRMNVSWTQPTPPQPPAPLLELAS